MLLFGILIGVSEGWGEAVCLAVLVGPVGAFLLFLALISHSISGSKQNTYQHELALAEPKPSDSQVDAWHQDDIEKLKERTLELLDLQPEEFLSDCPEPIVVVGPGDNPAVRVGEDGYIRFSVHNVLIACLTENHLAAYKCTVNLTDGIPLNETTQEYHYQDIVSVSTQVDTSEGYTIVVNGQQQAVASQQRFALSVASGEKIQMGVAFPQLTQFFQNGKVSDSNVDQAIRQIRTVLREKRG